MTLSITTFYRYAVIPNGIMLNIVMLNSIMPSVVMLSVIAPAASLVQTSNKFLKTFSFITKK